MYTTLRENAVAQWVEALSYKTEGCGFDSRCCLWNFLFDMILPVDSADNLTTFMGRLYRNLETSTFCNFLCLSLGLLYR